jgi:ABC-type phosphate/phosphonate transport system substrate-binding protein
MGLQAMISANAMRIAALPMYDLPELAAANDALWSAIAERLNDLGVDDIPNGLTREGPLEAIWTDPRLLLAQTCGYPLVTSLRGRVQVVATPRYSAEGCEGVLYRSAVVVRAEDPATRLADVRSRRLAVNDLASNSGMNLLRAEIAPLAAEPPFRGAPFFAKVTLTGAHVASLEAVAAGEADAAAIDCVVWAHLRRFRPALTQGLRILAWTRSAPGLPLIASASLDVAQVQALRTALTGVAQDQSLAAVRATLRLEGFETMAEAAYAPILALEAAAIAQGYPHLR